MFQLDKIFRPRPAKATLKVTFTDRSPAHWRLVATNAEGETVKRATVENTGDQQRKTMTFEIEELAAQEKFPGNMDFRLITEGPAIFPSRWFACSSIRQAQLIDNG